MTIRLSENFRAVFYAPFYAAHALGSYEAEGVAVDLVPAAAPGQALRGLIDGSLDLTWGGPMRVMKHIDEGGAATAPLACFCEVVGRDPFFLVGRGENPAFRLADLPFHRLATVAEVPTPWLCLQEDLRREGIDPARLTRTEDRPMAESVAALRAGEVDLVQLFEPFVSIAEREGGAVWHAAAKRGPTAYTTFYATRDAIARHREDFIRMVRAITRTQAWIVAHGADELARAVAPFFPDVASDLLAAAYARYLEAGVWSRAPVISPEGFERLQASLLSGGFIGRRASYDDCIDSSLAEDAMA